MPMATHLAVMSAPQPGSDHLHRTDSRSSGSCRDTPTILQTIWRLLRLELQSERCSAGCFYCPGMQLPGISQAVYSLYHWDFLIPFFFLWQKLTDSALGITGRVLVAGTAGVTCVGRPWTAPCWSQLGPAGLAVGSSSQLHPKTSTHQRCIWRLCTNIFKEGWQLLEAGGTNRGAVGSLRGHPKEDPGGGTGRGMLLRTQLEIRSWKEVLHARGGTSEGLQVSLHWRKDTSKGTVGR